MGRPISGAVEWRTTKGKPPGWHARVRVLDKVTGAIARPWVYLNAPQLVNTPEDRERARKMAVKVARLVKDRGGEYVGERHAAPVRIDATIAELEEKWLALVDADPSVKGATRHQHRSIMRAHVVPLLGTRSPREMTTPVLRAFFRQKTVEKSASTVRNIANTLTRFFADVKAEGWSAITVNPMRDDEVRAVLPSVQAPDAEDIVHMSPEAVTTLLAHPGLDEADFGAFLLQLTGGLREGEVYGARFSDVDLEEDVLRVRVVQQALMPRGTGGGVELGPLKSRGSKRPVPLHPLFAAWLVGWTLTGWRVLVGRDPKPGDLVFPDRQGRAQRPRSADKLRGYLAAAGLPTTFATSNGEAVPFDAHSMRHSFATLLGSAEVPGDIADRLLGHAATTTRGRHYQAPKLATLARAVLSLELAVPPRLVGGFGHVLSPSDVQKSSQLLEPPSRVELETCGLRNRCSTTELRRRRGAQSTGGASRVKHVTT
jgi:integrase